MLTLGALSPQEQRLARESARRVRCLLGDRVRALRVFGSRRGDLLADRVRPFSPVQQDREDADDQSAAVFDESAAREIRATAARILAAAEERLRAEGFLGD